jgi:hypothetical protein
LHCISFSTIFPRSQDAPSYPAMAAGLVGLIDAKGA